MNNDSFQQDDTVLNSFTESKSAGGIVLNSNDEVLVVSQRNTSFSLPKGHVESDEDDLAAAKREIYEESGIKQLQYVAYLGTYQRFKISESGGDDTSELKNIAMFLFETDQVDLSPVDPHNPEARWVKKEKVSELLTHQKDKEFFSQWLSSTKKNDV
jgi:8-oxo-dGTP pyrophosphatase MutT (NUDIX family)